MTSQPVANHRPSPLPQKPDVRRRNLRLNLEDGQLQKRIHMFEEFCSSGKKDENSDENSNGNGLWCRQPRVISPEQKRWTQLDVTNDQGKEVSRKKGAQQTMHGYGRSPLSPGGQKPIIYPRRRMEIGNPVIKPAIGNPIIKPEIGNPIIKPAIDEKPVPRGKQAKITPAVHQAAKDDRGRNSVFAIVSAFENGKPSLNAVSSEQPRKIVAVAGAGSIRERRNSESTSQTGSVSRKGSERRKLGTLQSRMSRSMDSLVQEFETVAFEMSRNGSQRSCEDPASPTLPQKPQRTFEQDIYDQSKVKQAKRRQVHDELRRKPSMERICKPQRTFEQDLYNRGKALRLKQSLSNGHVKKEDEGQNLRRTNSAKETVAPQEENPMDEFPDNNCSKNCNHNGEMENRESEERSSLYDQGTEFTTESKKIFYDAMIIENNNRSLFLDRLKSPISRRPKLPSPPPPPTQVPFTQPAPTDHKSVSILSNTSHVAAHDAATPTPAPRNLSKLNGIGTLENGTSQVLSVSSSNASGCISPGNRRRMTDGALIASRSPKLVSRRRQDLDRPLPIVEYAEPITIKRSASDESLATSRRPAPVVDTEGYSVPGSHLWVPAKSTTLRPKPILRRDRASPKLPDYPGMVKLRDKSQRGKAQHTPAASTGEAGVAGHDVKREGGFRQRSKLLTMRRKINDAFRRKHHHQQKMEEDRISVTSEGSDTEVNEQVLKKRLTYVRAMRLRSSVYCTMQPRLALQYAKLYEYAVIVSLQMNEATRRYEPYEMRRFPYEVSDSQTDKLRAIPQFCFPDAFKWAPVEQYNSESFCFVLTSSDGSRVYGYNRRILPPGNGPRLPEVVCVMSPIGCYPIYNQLLDEIENRRRYSMSAVENLLKLSYECQFPRPGSHTKVFTPPSKRRNHFGHLSEHKPLVLQRPQDQRLEHVDFDTLFNCLNVHRVVQIFASLLLERRVIMCSGKLSKLSRCSQALAGLLYPFSWQHVYVPVLPEKLIDMCCSPTPYIMGMLSLCIPRLEEMPLEEVLIVDLDSRDFYTVVGDEETILPKKLSAALERALKVCSMSSWEGADTDDELSEDHEAKNSAISEAFIRFFVETVGHYSYHFTQQYDGSQKFDREGFVKAVSSKSVRNFLEVFSETQMFSLFIQEKETEIEGISQGLFERRVREFENESKSNSKNIGAKMKKIGKAVKEMKDSGLKLAESAKGVKSRMKHSLDDRI